MIYTELQSFDVKDNYAEILDLRRFKKNDGTDKAYNSVVVKHFSSNKLGEYTLGH